MTQATIAQTKTDNVKDLPVPPQIFVTTDYHMFRLMGGNRTIDYNHVRELKQAMRENPQLLASNPISVNEHLFIIDGQHRWSAARELNVSLYYIVSPGLSLDETRVLNVTQRRWTLLDFAQSYANSGQQEYKIFLELHKDYPEIAPSILRLVLSGGFRHDLGIAFRRGELQINDLEQAKRTLPQLHELAAKAKIRLNLSLAQAILHLTNGNEDFDFERFIRKFDREAVRDQFHVGTTMKACLRAIEDAYNYQSKVVTRLY